MRIVVGQIGKTRRWVVISLGLSALAACGFELDFPPDWQIDEPGILAVRAHVISVALEPWRAEDERELVAALPGDVIRVEPLVVDVDGDVIADPDLRWFVCSDLWTCDDEVTEPDLPLCGPVPQPPCDLGSGASIDFVTPQLGELSATWDLGTVMAVHGHGGVGAERCVALWQGVDDQANDLERCDFYTHTLQYGPPALFSQLHAEAGIELVPKPSEFEAIAFEEEPNYAPLMTGFAIEIEREGDIVVDLPVVASASEHRVEPGDQVHLSIPDVEGNAQMVTPSQNNQYAEGLTYLWKVAGTVEGVSTSPDGVAQSWTASGAAGERIVQYAIIADSRDGVSWAWITFVIE